VRIARELPTDTLYRIVEVEEVPEVGTDRETVPPMVELVRKTCHHILHAVKRATPEMEAALGEQVPPGVLCDQIASALIPVPGVQQALLEEADVERRLRRLLAELSALLKQLKDG